MQPLIELKDLSKVFSTEDIDTYALNEINLTINEGEYVSISGPSGCGKSTLLSILGLLDTPTSGQQELNGHDVKNLTNNQRSQRRNRDIGFIFQSFNLISEMNAEENIGLPLTYRSDLSKSRQADMVKAALASVDMLHRSGHYPSQLSGGQQQRIAVARAIVGNPCVILADEPTGNLDTKNAAAVMELFDELHQQGATIIMVTHDPDSALRASRQIKMLDGRVISDVSTAKTKAAA